MNFKEIDERFLSNYDKDGNFQSNKLFGGMFGYWLKKHMIDVKNLVVVESVLKSDVIFVEVDDNWVQY